MNNPRDWEERVARLMIAVQRAHLSAKVLGEPAPIIPGVIDANDPHQSKDAMEDSNGGTAEYGGIE